MPPIAPTSTRAASPSHAEAAGSIARTLASHTLHFLASRAIYWPATCTLIIADVHLGKAETLASCGVPAPDGLTLHDLARLSQLIVSTGAHRVLVLGDLLHAPAGLTSELIASVAAWREQHPLSLQLVPGNHDRKLSAVKDAWKLDVLDAMHIEAGLQFVHEPMRNTRLDPALPTLCGHLHPMVLLKNRSDRLRLQAYLLSQYAAERPAQPPSHTPGTITQVVLPAFCTFASGVAMRHVGETLAIAGERVIAV